MNTFKERLNFLIEAKFLNKASIFSEKTGIDEGTISNWRNLDIAPNITKKTEKKIESVNINPDWLFKNEGNIMLKAKAQTDAIPFSEHIAKYGKDSAVFSQFKNSIENTIKNKFKTLEMFYNNDDIDFRFKDIIKSFNYKDPYFIIFIEEYFPKFDSSKILLDIISDIESVSTKIQPNSSETKPKPVVNGQHKGVPYYSMDVTGSIVRSFSDIQEAPEFYVDFKPLNDCTAYLTVHGDSMFPKYCSGDIVAVKKFNDCNTLLWGEAYMVITDEEANCLRTIKLIHQHPENDKLILRASNPNYPGDTIISKKNIVNIFIVKGKIKLEQF